MTNQRRKRRTFKTEFKSQVVQLFNKWFDSWIWFNAFCV